MNSVRPFVCSSPNELDNAFIYAADRIYMLPPNFQRHSCSVTICNTSPIQQHLGDEKCSMFTSFSRHGGVSLRKTPVVLVAFRFEINCCDRNFSSSSTHNFLSCLTHPPCFQDEFRFLSNKYRRVWEHHQPACSIVRLFLLPDKKSANLPKEEIREGFHN